MEATFNLQIIFMLFAALYLGMVCVEALIHERIITKNKGLEHDKERVKILTLRGFAMIATATFFQWFTGYFGPTWLFLCLLPFIHWVFFDHLMIALLWKGVFEIDGGNGSAMPDKFFSKRSFYTIWKWQFYFDHRILWIGSKILSLVLVVTLIWVLDGSFGAWLLSYD